MLYPPVFAAESSNGLLGALGINLQALIINAIAFLIILWLLSKFIYPILNKALDAKAEELSAATRMQQQAKEALDKADEERQAALAAAAKTADEIIAAAKADAAGTIDAARDRATKEADRIVAEAREQLTKDVAAARRTLRTETAMLVAQATESVIGTKLDDKADKALIASSLEQRS